ncbi:MAG TPA: hypothetical protein PKW75_02900 [candidate division Zixibacteria bacterium]|nr:PHP domain-containing protein [candidate division Zixibacteria bacterium]MDD4917019.1 hypothetical protein [candidate division Zixibacteria bacterium]MDM7971427.1 hypothetical protein [candidate division Zixibacteria bacterium]HOD66636.1 hypothetical protein [candidate division Zixibacteria bacterium]HOZ07212.1 hypothetical protein [candidate division Zixibacteria bacterium]
MDKRKVGDWYHYTGAVHIHTTESDGTLPLEEVIALGREVGLDFMMFADHMTLSNRQRGGEGMYGDTLVVIGYEHNDERDRHHYLLFGSPGVYPPSLSARQYVAAGAADGAIGIMAHPDEIRNSMPEFPPYPWDDWSVEGFTGIELWNQMSEWMERLTPRNRLAMAFAPRRSMIGPSDRILRRWDEISRKRKCVGIVGADAHAFPIKVGPFRFAIFPYKVHFKCLRMTIILPEPMSRDFVAARDQLYEAIRDCRAFGANVRWGQADRFLFCADNGRRRVPSGGTIELTETAHMRIELPARARIRLVHDGCTTVENEGQELIHRLDAPGIYRVEAWKGRRGWIFSNHIRVEA